MPRVALTGATGFLGLHLLPALLERGFAVRILARRPPPKGAWAGLPFETVHGSLADGAALQELVEGAAVVVHAAGLIKARSRADFLRVNRDGTAALASATRKAAPDARFLLISSLAAREPHLSDYAFSKHAAEQAASAAFSEVPGQLAIIRPPAIYGPWDRETLRLFRAAGRAFAPVPGKGRVAVVHAKDAARGIAALAASWRAGRFALADTNPEGYPPGDLLRAAGAAMGRTPRLVPLPAPVLLPVLLAAGAAAGLWSRLTGTAQIFGPGKAREILHPDWSVRAGDLLPAEIFRPRFGLEQGFADTVAWYRRAGWL